MIDVLLIAGLLILAIFAADGSLIAWVVEKYYNIKGWGKFRHE